MQTFYSLAQAVGTVVCVPWYVPAEPPPSIAHVLACTWTATPSGTHRLVPDACLDLLWIDGAGIWLCGPETTAWDFALPVGTTSVGVRFRPGIASPLFALDVSTIRDRRVRLDQAGDGPVAADAATQLLTELDAAPDSSARVAALVRFVAEQTAAAPADVPDPVAEHVLDVLASTPRATAAELSTALGMTTRQLHRRSMRSFGYGTSVLARLLRFQRFLALAEAGPDTDHSLAGLAADAGYADQPHLARECRSITGQTPSAFLEHYFPTFPDMSDPYRTTHTLTSPVNALPQ